MSAGVLIVEDEPLVAMVVEEVLLDAGIAIAGCAGSVEKALTMLDDTPCDAALLDVNLRGRSVEPVAVALQSKGIPFLFMSGYGSHPLPRQFSQAPVLPKPFDAKKLISAVKQILP